MRLDKVLRCMFLSSFLTLTLYKTQSLFTPYRGSNQKKRAGYVIKARKCMSAKQKIVRGRGPSNIKFDIFVCFFDVCWASKAVPSIYYDVTNEYRLPARPSKNRKIQNQTNDCDFCCCQ